MTAITLIVIALAIALDPLPLVPFILLLTSKRGVRKGAAFLVGWCVSLAAIVALTIVATGNMPPEHGSVPAWVALMVKLLIGVVLLIIGLRKWRSMGRPPRPKAQPKWQRGIDDMSLWFAAALAPITQPWGLIAAGVTTVLEVQVGSAASVLVLVMFVLVATSSYIVLEVGAAVRPERAQRVATALRGWIESHTDRAIAVGATAVGAFLVASSAYQLLT
ncbi:MAG: GAP family protein [Miltoncostaeaceae bacterium]